MKTHCLPALLAVLLTPLLLHGQEEPSEEPRYTLEELVVTATRIPWPLEFTPKSVTVITAEEIQARQARTVLDVLREVPGLSVARAGSWGSQAGVFLRGGNSNHTLVLLDGVPVNSPTLGGFNWADLTTDNVERVEIVRGPQSTLYGSEAIGGVINIVTRTGRESPRSQIELKGGDSTTFQELATTQGRLGQANYAASISRWDTRGELVHDRYENTSFTGKFHLIPDRHQALTLFSRFIFSSKRLPPLAGRFGDPNQSMGTDLRQIGSQYEYQLTPRWHLQTRLSLTDEDFSFRNPQDPTAPFDFFQQINTRILHTELLQDYTLARDVIWVAGGEWKHLKGTSFSNFGRDFERAVVNRALFTQLQAALSRQAFLVAGLRWDNHSQFGSDLTGQVSLGYLVRATHTKLKGSWGSGFRAPSINELFFPDFGNPDLQAEESIGYEVGIEQTAWQGRVHAEGSYFRNQVRNLSQAVQVSDFVFRAVNVARAETEGVELTLTLKPLSPLLLRGSYTRLEARDETAHQRLLRRPRHQGAVGASYHLGDRATIRVDGIFVGERLDFGGTKLHPYQRVDLAIALKPLPRVSRLSEFRVLGRIENLFDEAYEEVAGFQAPGFTYTVGFATTF